MGCQQQPHQYDHFHRWDERYDRYAYDDANRLKIVTDTLGAANSYTYDTSGLRNGLSLGNGINVSYGYDALSRLTNITQTLGASTIATYTYTLDAVGNRNQVDEKGGNYSKWLYDDSNRLISETRQVSSVVTTSLYTYDKTGNRLQQTVNGSPVMTGTYNELDQLISDGTKQYSYDGRGNLTQITGGTKYKWDGADRLISATVTGGTALYIYDDAGRRVKQTQGTTVTNYLWDEISPFGDVVYESDGTTATNYTLGNGELISQKRGSNSTEYFLMDGHSGVRSLVGSSTQYYNYDAFGNLQNFSGTPNTKYLYAGQQFDSLTSLYDFRARYYNPGQGRFLSRDTYSVNFNNPIELNRYGYTANNPTNYIDPSGLVTETPEKEKPPANEYSATFIPSQIFANGSKVTRFSLGFKVATLLVGSIIILGVLAATLQPQPSAGGACQGSACPTPTPPTTFPPLPSNFPTGPISLSEALELANKHLGGTYDRFINTGNGTNYQFLRTITNSAGQTETRIARFDINPVDSHVIAYGGPHLNLEIHINGKQTIDIHIDIDITSIRPGDHP